MSLVPTKQRATVRPYRSSVTGRQRTSCPVVANRRALVASVPQAQVPPPAALHVCEVSGASMPCSRILVSPTRIVSPSVTVAEPSMTSAAEPPAQLIPIANTATPTTRHMMQLRRTHNRSRWRAIWALLWRKMYVQRARVCFGASLRDSLCSGWSAPPAVSQFNICGTTLDPRILQGLSGLINESHEPATGNGCEGQDHEHWR